MSDESLITAVSECPVLYDLTLKAYHDLTKRNQAWRDISSMLGVTGENYLLIIYIIIMFINDIIAFNYWPLGTNCHPYLAVSINVNLPVSINVTDR